VPIFFEQGVIQMWTSALFVAKTKIKFFKIYSVSTSEGTGERRWIEPVLIFFWTRGGQFFMILYGRPLWMAPEQKNSKVKHGYRPSNSYTIDSLNRVCITDIACLHDQNKSGFCGGPAFIQPFRTVQKVFKEACC